MNASMEKQLFGLLGQTYTYLKRSEVAYAEYLSSGKKFRHARILRIYNKSLRKLLMQYAHILPVKLHADAISIVAHYDVWMQKWSELKKKNDPEPEDEFAFANEHHFPKEAAQNLENEYLAMKSALESN